AKRFFERHHQFHLVQRVRPQVVHKRRRGRHFRLIHAELLDDNLLHAFFHAGHSRFLRDLLSLAMPRLLVRLGSCVKTRSVQPGISDSPPPAAVAAHYPKNALPDNLPILVMPPYKVNFCTMVMCVLYTLHGVPEVTLSTRKSSLRCPSCREETHVQNTWVQRS